MRFRPLKVSALRRSLFCFLIICPIIITLQFVDYHQYRQAWIAVLMTRSWNPIFLLFPTKCIELSPGFDGGGNFNRIMELNGIARLSKDRKFPLETLLVPPDWAAWMESWYGPSSEWQKVNGSLSLFPLKIFPKESVQRLGRCEIWGAAQIFRGSKYVKNINYNVWDALVPMDSIKAAAKLSIEKLRKPGTKIVATVHKRNLDGDCSWKLSEYNKQFCHFTLDRIVSELQKEYGIADPLKNVTIILLSDGQKAEEDATFPIKSDDKFNVQTWMSTISDYHFGNPGSSSDYLICHEWRRIFCHGCGPCFPKFLRP